MYKMKDEPPWKRRVVVGGGGGGEEVRVEVCFAGCETLRDPFYEDILSFYWAIWGQMNRFRK